MYDALTSHEQHSRWQNPAGLAASRRSNPRPCRQRAANPIRPFVPREGNLIAQFAFAFQEGYLASSRDEAGAALRGVVDDQLIVTVVKIGDRKDVYR